MMYSEAEIREALAESIKPEFMDRVKSLKSDMDAIKEQARRAEPIKKPARETIWSKKTDGDA